VLRGPTPHRAEHGGLVRNEAKTPLFSFPQRGKIKTALTCTEDGLIKFAQEVFQKKYGPVYSKKQKGKEKNNNIITIFIM